jgi:hypothetical protein
MRAGLALIALLSSGCNAILGNDSFRGPGDAPSGGDGSVPGDASSPDACSGIGCMVANCARQGKPPTSLSGVVYAPNGTLPLYNALVYIPTAPLDPIEDGPANPACASGTPAVHAFTDVSGQFKLENVPTVANLPLVIQVGKWRREITVASVNECADLALPATSTRLPRNSSEGHLPRIAVSTGFAEPLECALRSIGVSDAEFATAGAPGRIDVYREALATVDQIGTRFISSVDSLHGLATLYDMVLFSCDGEAVARSPVIRAALLDYIMRGGWVWLSHMQGSWLVPPTPFPALATFELSNNEPPQPLTARIDTTSAKGQAFNNWLSHVGATSPPGQISLTYNRNNCKTIDSSLVQRHMFLEPSVSSGLSGVQMFSWSPSGGGRLVYSDVHFEHPIDFARTFPGECTGAPLTAQGKAIAFQLFDQPTCVP